jgi:hypothetical protein
VNIYMDLETDTFHHHHCHHHLLVQSVSSTMTSPTTLEVRTKDGIKFGKELRDKEFMFEKGFLNLNHGE